MALALHASMLHGPPFLCNRLCTGESHLLTAKKNAPAIGTGRFCVQAQAFLLLQERLQRILQAAGRYLVAVRLQHLGHILLPGLLRRWIITARQQLQLQRSARIDMVSRSRHFSRHFQAQQCFACITSRRRCNSLTPSGAHCARHAAQLLRSWEQGGIALAPGIHHLCQRLAVRLACQLAQCSLGVIERIALGTEGGIPQTWTTVFSRCAVKTVATAKAIITTAFIAIATRGATVAPIAPVTRFATTASNHGRITLHAWAVIAAALGNHWLGGRCSGCWRRGFHGGICASLRRFRFRLSFWSSFGFSGYRGVCSSLHWGGCRS